MVRILTGAALMVAFAAHAAPDPVYACSYWDKKTDAVETLDRCVEKRGDKLVFLPELFAKTASVGGMSWAGLHGYSRAAGLPDADFYVLDAENYLPVIHYDNGPDWFVEGLVRSRQQGKIGYWDDNFRNRIAPQYDYASQFKDGRALVCKGCKAQRNGDRVELVGGEWFYIDKHGNRVSESAAAPF